MGGQRRNRRIAGDDDASTDDSVDRGDLLDDSRRRYLLAFLRESGACQLTELAQAVASKETDSGARTVSQARLRAVYLDLQRNHLPALEEAGLVQYATDVGHVTLCGTDDVLGRCLDATEEP